MTSDQERNEKLKPALLIIDVQKRYMPGIAQGDREKAFYFINLLIEAFRKYNFPIIRIYHSNVEIGPLPGTDEFEFHDTIRIRPEDTRIIKKYSDSFNKTELDSILKKMGCNTLFLCGQSAVGCVLATRYGAMNYDYRPFIVKDAIMSHDSGYTRNIEVMFDAISLDVVKLLLDNCR
jgi:nicotinamidase-related amidase